MLAEEVAFVAGNSCQPADLVGDRTFLIEGQRQRVARSVELIAYPVDSRDLNGDVAVE